MIYLKRFGWTVKVDKARKSYGKIELKKNLLKYLLSSVTLKWDYKMYFKYKFLIYSKYSSLSYYRRYCMFTYSGKSVFKAFKLGRHAFKKFASLGYLSGLRKSSF